MAASSKTLSKEQIANLSKREKTTILIAIVSLYFVVCSTMTISPALQTLYNAFPDFDRTTVMYIYTLPSLVGIPVTILIGLIAGTKVRYRTILLSATALMVVMGVAPFFIDNLYAILACRFLFGIGQASCLGVEVSLMYMFFSGKELARYMGFTQVAGSLGNIVFMQIGGILATTGWHMVFLAYLIVTVAFVLVLLFMKEPELSAPAKKAKASDAAAGTVSAKKDRIPLASWVCIFLVFFFTLVFQGLTVSLSSLVSELGIGDAATTGTLSSISMVFGMIVSAFFGPIFSVTKRFGGRVLCLFGMAAAFLIMISMRSFVGIAASMCLFSFFGLQVMISSMASAANGAPDSVKGKIGAFCQTGVKIAVFIVSYYTAASLAVAPATGLYAFAPSAAQYSADLWTGALLCIICGVVGIVALVAKKGKGSKAVKTETASKAA